MKREIFPLDRLLNLVMIVVGSAIYAIGLDCFEVPNGLAAGGASGLATIIAKVLKGYGIIAPIGMQVIIMNLLLLIPAMREGGLRYVRNTVVGMLVSSVLVDAFAPVLPVLGGGDMILCALWGGVICGLGLGIVFRAGANTGGSDIVAQILAQHTPLSVSYASLAVDFLVVALSIPVFGIENALYAIIAMYMAARMLDLVLDGFGTQRAAYVISDEWEEIKQHIFSDLDRGCTELLARGGYTGKDRPVIFVVLNRSEMAMLRRIVAEVDPNATIVVSMIHDAFGNGFSSITSSLG